jgi:hypothetical protein
VSDLSRLKSQLATSGLQEKNQALYQIISQLIDASSGIQDVTVRTTQVINSLVFTNGSVIFAAGAGNLSEDNANFFYDDSDPTLEVHKLAGGRNAGDQLFFFGSKNFAGNNEPFKWFTNGNPATPNQMSLFSTGTLCVAGGGATPVVTSLGSGGVFISAVHQTASGGFQAASNAVGAGTDIGYIDFGTLGTPSAEKRVAAIHGFLTASAAATPTGEMRFYTTLAGAITEGFALTEDGKIRFNSTRGKLFAPANNQFTFEANNSSTGFGLQSGTNDTMLVANHAHSAFGEVLALQYRLEAANKLYWNGRTAIRSSANGFLEVSNAALAQGFGIQAGVDTLVVANLAQSAFGDVKCLNLFVEQATFMIRTGVAFTNNAAAAVGTLNNAPAAGNPTKWIGIDDNGTTRFIPAW